VRSKDAIHHFKAPVLSGPDGEPLEIPDALAQRLRKSALDQNPCSEEWVAGLPAGFTETLFHFARDIAKKPVEYGVLISDQGKLLLKKQGSASSVGIERDLLHMSNFLHNHPGGTPPSQEDIEALFVANPSSVWVVGGDWLYGVKAGPGGSTCHTLGHVMLSYSYVSRAAFAVIHDLFLHDLSIEASSLEARHLHAVLSELAENGLLQYCRVRYGL
jgi:hypothetical protein